METPNADKYFTVGEAAKKMGVSVRTLQYYHKIGLLPPSGISEGGRRQYTYRDLVQLHQILSLKHLGFSLQDIKERLPSLDTPEQVAQALEQQAQDTRSKIQELTATLQELEALRTEVLQMQSVDFKKYADIIVNLQMHNDYYWLIKHFDSQTMDYIRRRFDSDSGTAMIQTFTRLQEQALQLQRQGFPPDSPQGQELAASFWNMIQDFTGGNMEMLPKLVELGSFSGADPDWQQKQQQVNAYLEPALEHYLSNLGIDPFQKEEGQ